MKLPTMKFRDKKNGRDIVNLRQFAAGTWWEIKKESDIRTDRVIYCDNTSGDTLQLWPEEIEVIEGYTQEIRVNGVVVEGTNTIFLDNARCYERLLKCFFGHLKIAFMEPSNFEFDGYGGKMNADEFISFHQNRLKSDLKGNIELVFDGVVVDNFEV